jgi:predicted small secreted protein
MKNLFIILILTAFTFLSACNTMEGLGKDIEKGGQKLSDKASD